MSALSAIALTGMRAAQTRLQTNAHNLANLGTADFRRQVVAQETGAAGGVVARVERTAAPGAALEDDLVGVREAGHAFLANLAVFRANDRLLGQILDIVA